MWRIPLSNLNYNNQEIEAVTRVLQSGWITMGPLTRKFEEAFAERIGTRHAVAVTNCTVALELVYRYVLGKAGVTGKTRIIIPDITFVATANAVLAAGGTPLLCDVDSPTAPFLSTSDLERNLGEQRDVAAVVLVHYAGMDYNSEAVQDICDRHSVPLIEDCAHAIGASAASGRILGSIGLAGCFSFFSNKNLSTGEGGMITTNDDALAQWLRLARSHGVTAGTWDRHEKQSTAGYDVVSYGTNARCTEITAALGLAQLAKLNEANEKRRSLTALYQRLLAETTDIAVIAAADIDQSSCHIMSVICRDAAQRDKVRQTLTDYGIQTSHHYPPIHTFSHYAKGEHADPDLDNSNAIEFADRQLTLPLWPGLTDDEVVEITNLIRVASQ